MLKSREAGRHRRHSRTRKKVSGLKERPRLSVYRSLNHMYAQIIDDTEGKTLVSASSLGGKTEDTGPHKGNIGAARQVGTLIGNKAREKGITKVVFDRSGYLYHGRVKALAEAAREAGLEF